jgi:hypothetical protein
MSVVRPQRSRFAGLLALAALLSVPVFLWTSVVPHLSGAGLQAHHGHVRTILVHLIGGSLMLMAGGVALAIGVTGRGRRWHRVAGTIYLVTGTAGAASGMVASFGTPHAIGLSTLTLGLVWFGAVGMAVRAAVNRRFDQHRAWMIRSYVVAWASILFRLWTHLLPASWQFPPSDMLWTSWVIPLFVAELWLGWKSGAATIASRSPLS